MIIDILIIAILIITIGLGAIGFLRPRWTMELLDLAPSGGNQGFSEVRAVNGALFIGLGLAGIFLQWPTAPIVVGAAYVAAAVGRITAIFLDDAGTPLMWRFFACEAVFGVALIGLPLI